MRVNDAAGSSAKKAPDYGVTVSPRGANGITTVVFEDANEVGPRVEQNLGISDGERSNLIATLKKLDDPNDFLRPILNEAGPASSDAGVTTGTNKAADVLGLLVTVGTYNPGLGIIGWLVAKGVIAANNRKGFGETANPRNTWRDFSSGTQPAVVRDAETEGAKQVQAALLAAAQETPPSA